MQMSIMAKIDVNVDSTFRKKAEGVVVDSP